MVLQQEPDGTESTVTTASSPGTLTTASTPLARISAGVFRLNPGTSADEAGYWIFRAATGTAESAAPDFVYKVLPSEFFADATLGAQRSCRTSGGEGLAQRAQHRERGRTGARRDDRGRLRAVVNEAGREFYTTTSTATRLFSVDFDSYWNRTVKVGDLADLDSVRLLDRDGTSHATVAAADTIPHPRNRKPWEPITRLEFTADVIQPISDGAIEVTGTWGFPLVPADIKRAVLEGVVAEYDRQVEHYRTDLGAQTGGEGQNVVVFAGRPQLLDLPPKVLGTVRRYQEPSGWLEPDRARASSQL